MTTATTFPTASSESTPVLFGDQIVLTELDRSRLQTFVHLGHESARARTRAQVALKLGRAGASPRSAERSTSAATQSLMCVPALRKAGWMRCCVTSDKCAIAKP